MPRVRRILALLFALALFRCSSAPAPEPAPAPSAPVAAPAPAPAAETVTVTASALNVRRDPATTADVVAKVQKGDRLTVLLRDAGWVKVTTPAGEIGWVAAQHVSSASASSASAARPRNRRGGCPPDAEFQFTKTPTPSFSDRGAHGLVVVDATVDIKGNVVATKIISNNTGDEALGFLAEREIKSAKFSPPIRNCVPRTFIFTYKRSF